MAEIGRQADVGDGRRPAALALQELTPSLHAALRPSLRAAGYAELTEQPLGQCAYNGTEMCVAEGRFAIRRHGPDVGGHFSNRYGVALTTRAPLGPLRHGRCAWAHRLDSRSLPTLRAPGCTT
jgi:hypothetical protein